MWNLIQKLDNYPPPKVIAIFFVCRGTGILSHMQSSDTTYTIHMCEQNPMS